MLVHFYVRICFISIFCSKEIANFHRPRAVWYPHDNEIAAKAQGAPCTNGPIKIVIMTLAGKGVKLHVDAEESLSSVKLKASKKLGLSYFLLSLMVTSMLL